MGPRRQGSRRGRAPLTEIRPTAAYSEQVAEGWWEATPQALQQVVEAVGADRISGLCITHQRESYAPVDTRNTSLRNAILWDDARAPGTAHGHPRLPGTAADGRVHHESGLGGLVRMTDARQRLVGRGLRVTGIRTAPRCPPPSRPPSGGWRRCARGTRPHRERPRERYGHRPRAGATGSALATPFRAAGWRVNLWGTGSTTTCSRRAPPAGPTRGPTSPSRPAPRCSTASGSASRSTGPTWPFSRSRRSACSRWRAGRSRASPARAGCC